MYPHRRRVGTAAAVSAASRLLVTVPALFRPPPALPVAHLALAPLVFRLLHLHHLNPHLNAPPTRTHILTWVPLPPLLTYTPRCHASSPVSRLLLQCIHRRCPKVTAVMRCDANWWCPHPVKHRHHLCPHTNLITTILTTTTTTTALTTITITITTQRCDAG